MWRRGPGAGRPGGEVTGPDGITGSHQPPRVLPLDGTRNEAPGLPAKPERLHRQPGACCGCEIAGGVADPHHSQRRSRVRRSATRRITPPGIHEPGPAAPTWRRGRDQAGVDPSGDGPGAESGETCDSGRGMVGGRGPSRTRGSAAPRPSRRPVGQNRSANRPSLDPLGAALPRRDE